MWFFYMATGISILITGWAIASLVREFRDALRLEREQAKMDSWRTPD